MEITIKGVELTPRWDTLEKLLCEAMGNSAQIIRIAREDNGVDYRAAGVYNLTIQCRGNLVDVVLKVEA